MGGGGGGIGTLFGLLPSPAKPDTSAADRAYELQKEQLELQKKQLTELETKEKGADVAKQAQLDNLLKKKKTGMSSTILTDSGILNETVKTKALLS